jgi:UDP-N-acetylmuramate dehydrogenase
MTTLGLGGEALALVRAETRDDLPGLERAVGDIGGTPVVIGRGSNILADDRALPLVLIMADFRQGPEVIGHGEEVRVRVGAGVALPQLLSWAAKHGLSGLEGLAGVPGSVGGALIMNAGSYGCEFGPLVQEALIFSPREGVRRLERRELAFTYRRMLPPPVREQAWWLVCEVVLALLPAPGRKIRAAMCQCLERKRRTQPVYARSAGCVFKNPAGLSAGRLLEEAGMKGKRLGGMMFSSLHANFLINADRGTSAAALELLDEARTRVRAYSGIELECEVKQWLP